MAKLPSNDGDGKGIFVSLNSHREWSFKLGIGRSVAIILVLTVAQIDPAWIHEAHQFIRAFYQLIRTFYP